MDAPENTLESFMLAWERGSDGIEGDFHVLKDGGIACMHDSDTFRTTGTKAELAKLDTAELKRLDAGFWKGSEWKGAKVPLLKEVVDAMPEGKEIFVEIKDNSNDILFFLADMIKAGELNAKQVVVISFAEDVVGKAKEILSESKALLLTGMKYEEGKGLAPSADELIRRMTRINADGIDCCACQEIDKTFIDSIKNKGFEVHMWTVNDIVHAKKLVEMGVDSITSDCAFKLKQALAGE